MIGWLFFFGSLVGAWFTYNAFRPIYAPAKIAVVSFFAGWLTNELVLHHLVWQMALAAIFLALGALHTPAGYFGLAITMGSWVGLAELYRRSTLAEGAVEKALVTALGESYRTRIDPAVGHDKAPTIDWRQLANPFPIHHPEVKRVRDIVFRRTAGINLKLDVYHRRDLPKGAPVLLYIHGGGWVIGSKNEQGLPLMTHLASRGWVCVNANYRLAPHGTMPEPVIDLKHAIKWIREHAEEYGGDPSFLVVSGGSAGGHLAALVALTGNDPELQPGFEHVDTRVSGAIPIYGVYDLADRQGLWPHRDLDKLMESYVMKVSRSEAPHAYDKYSPIMRITPDAPPCLVIHGALDTLVPVEDARTFAEKLRGTSRAPVVYAEIPGAQHAFEIFPSLRALSVIHGIERFLAYLLSEHKRAAAQRAAAPPPSAPPTLTPPAPLGPPALA